MFAVATASPRQAARQAQQMINLLNPTANLSVDGVVGPKTRAAFEGLPRTGQEVVKNLLTSRNREVIASLTQPLQQEEEGEKRWYSKAELMPWMQAAATRYDIPVTLLEFYLEHEPTKRMIGGVMKYDAQSRSGSYRGLMQMGRLAWLDALEYDAETRGQKVLTGTSWSQNAYDARLNIYAAAAYAARQRRYARSAGFNREPTHEQFYAAHNQGPSFWTDALRGQRPQWYSGQSAKARRTIDTALAQMSRMTI